jgi:hypothetical protein
MAQGMLDVLVKQAKVASSDRPFDAIKKELYGIEAHSRRQLLIAEKLQQRYKRFLAKHNRAYPPISLNALREYRTKEGWPTFAIFSLHWPEFKIVAMARPDWSRPARGEVVFTPELPDAIENCYQDIGQNLLQRSQRVSGRVTLAAEFSGLIPNEVKDKIADAEPIFKEIFVIAEPNRWSLTEPARIPADPLVVGWDGEGLYLIAEFDTTPVEEALMLEGPANKRGK